MSNSSFLTAQLWNALRATSEAIGKRSFVHESVTFFGEEKLTSKGELTDVKLGLPLPLHLVAEPVTLRRETARDRFGKRLAINREYRCGDSDFDAACYLEGDVPDLTLAPLFASGEVRRSVLRLIANPAIASVLIAKDDRLLLTVKPPHLGDIDRIRAALTELTVLAPALQAAATEARVGATAYRDSAEPPPEDVSTLTLPSRSGRAGLLVFGYLTMLVSSWIFSSVEPATLGSPSGSGLILVVVLVAELAVLTALLRGRSDSLRLVLVFWLFGLIPVVGFVLGGLTLANARLDSGPPVEVSGVLQSEQDSKGSGYHWLAVVDGQRTRVDIGRSPDPRERHPATFTVMPGALGARWIVSVQQH